jgi:hypothetical protein
MAYEEGSKRIGTLAQNRAGGNGAIIALAALSLDGMGLHGIRFDRMRDSNCGAHLRVAGEEARSQEP